MVALRFFAKLRTRAQKRGMFPMTQSRRLLGVVMDPIDTIKPKKDSTLAMLLLA